MEIWHTLTGSVDKKEVQDAIRYINDELYSKPVTVLRFLISSNSADIGSSLGLYTYLKALPIECETICFGEVDVGAAVIFLAGKRRLAVGGAQFFFREGRYTIAEVTAPVHAHEEAIAVFKRQLSELIYVIGKETGNDTEAVAAMLRRSKIMSGEEALQFGLAHRMLATLPLRQQSEMGFLPEERK